MGLFEGKTTTERNKIIAAGVLGMVALVALYLAFFAGSGSKTKVTVTTTPTPKPVSLPTANKPDMAFPSLDEQVFQYETTPVVYSPGNAYAPDPGRNIFAFYEPPPPGPYVPPPPTPEIIKTPTPVPPPPILLAFVNPQTIYAGSRGFRLELSGDKFTPDARVYFNQTELPTIFVNAQKLVADIPANMIAQEGSQQVIVQTPDGKLYSNQFMFSVQEPPKPGMQYIGMIGRKRYNNDTAYFLDTGKTDPFGARLNDVLAGRFRLVDISPAEVVFEDVNLGFRHKIAIAKLPPGGAIGTGSGIPIRGIRNEGGFAPQFDPGNQKGNPPGIPGNIQPYVPPQQQQQQQKIKTDEKKEDVDDDGIG